MPLIQHTLQLMMTAASNLKISVERVVEKMSHAPAVCFQLNERGFLREGYFADITIYNPDAEYAVTKENVLYKCGWSPLEGNTLKGEVLYTIVNGQVAYQKGLPIQIGYGSRLMFS